MNGHEQRCPTCEAEGRESTTKMVGGSRNTKNVEFYGADPSITEVVGKTMVYRCSNGHQWTVHG
jgi:hypothetical protein